MGETFYEVLVRLFTTEHNRYLSSDQIVSHGLSSIGCFVALASLSLSLLWLTRKSVLARSSSLVRLFTGYFALLALQFLAQVIDFPDAMKFGLDYVCTVTGLLIAYVVFQKRHHVVGAIYEYKYTMGLLKTLHTFDKVDR